MKYRNMQKNFEKWINKKEELNNRISVPNFKERNIYWCGVGENVGDEENGKGEFFSRPVLIIRKFNRNLFWGVPLTTKNKENKFYIKITFDKKEQSAMITHLRLMDAKRLYKRIGILDEKDFNKIIEEVNNVLKIV